MFALFTFAHNITYITAHHKKSNNDLGILMSLERTPTIKFILALDVFFFHENMTLLQQYL